MVVLLWASAMYGG